MRSPGPGASPFGRWLLLAGLAALVSALLAGLAALGLAEHREALIAGLAASLIAALAGAVPLALGSGIGAAGKAAAARLLVGLIAIGAAALWGPWERRALLLGFAAGYVLLMAVESWAVLRWMSRHPAQGRNATGGR